MNDGQIEGWLNNKKIINYKGAVGYYDERAPYFKVGPYTYDAGIYLLYFDEYRRGNSYAEVDPASLP